VRRYGDGADQERRGDEAGSVGGEGRAGAGEGDEPARDGRGEDLHQPPGGPGDGVGGEALVRGGQDGDDRLVGRAEEGVTGRQARRHEIGVPDSLRPEERDDERRADEVGADQRTLATEAVDDDAGNRPQEQHGHDLGRDDASDGEPPPREPEDEDHQGGVMQRVPEAGEELPEPQRAVGAAAHDVAVGPEHQTKAAREGGRGAHAVTTGSAARPAA